MSIWFKEIAPEDIKGLSDNTMLENIGIELTEIGEQDISGKMPVDHRTVQPAGLLHGGASVTLAETLGSLGSSLIVDPEKYFCVGIEINANHIRSEKEGFVYGKASPVHLGRSTHIWSILITNKDGKLVCMSRITIAVRRRKNEELRIKK